MEFLKKATKSEGRIAIVNPDKCLPNKCNQECKKSCPVNANNKMCIEVTRKDKISTIYETLCIGCGICSNQCPFNAIKIINLPKELKEILHQYGANTFRFYKLPFLKKGHVIGLLGQNGIGKSSILNVLTGSIVPNLGQYDPSVDVTLPEKVIGKKSRKQIQIQLDPKEQIMKYFKGTQNYQFFKDLYDGKIKASMKPQRLKSYNQKESILDLYSKEKNQYLEEYLKLELNSIENTPIEKLSGGEKQRLAIFLTIAQDANLYIFDEPTNYLDIRQRLKVAQMIRNLAEKNNNNYIVVVDHDITILDYTTDLIHIIYGQPGAYGVVATVSKTSEAINHFFDGYLPSDNMRFRDQAYAYSLNLEVSGDDAELVIDPKLSKTYLEYPSIEVSYPDFELKVPGGRLPRSSSVNLILGPNGSGKSSFLKGLLKEDISYSYKPQYPEEIFKNKKFASLTTLNLLYKVIPKSMTNSGFKAQVVDALGINGFQDHLVQTLSGGEQQKLALIICLGKEADCYFIDEPSASLDIEERVKAMKVIKRFLVHNQKMGFIVEHDITMAFSLTKDVESRVLVFDLDTSSKEKRKGSSSSPMNCLDGLNHFLESIKVTFRMSTFSKRYRINRFGSGRDQEQKKIGKYII